MLKQRGPVRLRSSTLPNASQPIWPTSVISPVGSSKVRRPLSRLYPARPVALRTDHQPTGDDDAKKRAYAPLKSFLRQTTLPLAASRQERTLRTPRVTIFPSATVGEALGPENPEAGPVAPIASYLSCHNSFPVPASRQRVISPPSCRANT